MNATVNQIHDAERGLCVAIRTAANALDAIGTDDLSAALSRLQESADRAKCRLQAAAMLMNATLQGVAGVIESLAGEIYAGLQPEETPIHQPELPAPEPVALPEPGAASEPTPTEPPVREDSLGSLWCRDLIAALETVPENAPADVADAPASREDETHGNCSCDASDASQEAPLPVPDCPVPAPGKARSRRRRKAG